MAKMKIDYSTGLWQEFIQETSDTELIVDFLQELYNDDLYDYIEDNYKNMIDND